MDTPTDWVWSGTMSIPWEGCVSITFCYLLFRFKVSWFYSTFKFVNPSLFTLTKLSLDVYEEPHVRPCWFWLIFIFHENENFLFLSYCVGHWKSQQLLIIKSLSKVRLYFLEIIFWFEDKVKPVWNFAVLPPLHLFYQKSPSSKSRLRVYLLLVDRDPTTTTHTWLVSLNGHYATQLLTV